MISHQHVIYKQEHKDGFAIQGRRDDCVWIDVLGSQYLPACNNVRQGNSPVILPLAEHLLALDKYDEALGGALVEHLVLAYVSASHLVCLFVWMVVD